MAIVERVKNICLKPKVEWPVIAAETTTAGGLITGYVAPLVAVGAVAGLIGRSVIGVTVPFVGSYRVPLTAGIVSAIVAFVMAVVGVFVLSLIINALAPTFNGQRSQVFQQCLAMSVSARSWNDEQVLKIQTWLAKKSRKRREEQCEANRRAAVTGDHAFA